MTNECHFRDVTQNILICSLNMKQTLLMAIYNKKILAVLFIYFYPPLAVYDLYRGYTKQDMFFFVYSGAPVIQAVSYYIFEII